MKDMNQKHKGYLTKEEVKSFTDAVQKANKKYADNPSWHVTEPGCSLKVEVITL